MGDVRLKPATPEETINRRNTLFAAYIKKVFLALEKSGAAPVSLSGPLSPRSEILLGLKKPGEDPAEARTRIVGSFVAHYPLIGQSGAVTL